MKTKKPTTVKAIPQWEPCKFKIVNQGGPIVNSAHVVSGVSHVAAIHVDMKSKRCTIDAWGVQNDGSPTIYIGANCESLYLTPGFEKHSTEISFPEFKGWDFWATEISRYSLHICFVKKGGSVSDEILGKDKKFDAIMRRTLQCCTGNEAQYVENFLNENLITDERITKEYNCGHATGIETEHHRVKTLLPNMAAENFKSGKDDVAKMIREIANKI